MALLLAARRLARGVHHHALAQAVGHLTRDTDLVEQRSLHAEASGAQHQDASSSSSGATGDGPEERLLMRDFIHQSLYHPTRGYFNRPTPVVGTLDEPINCWKASTASEWRMLVAKKYKELGAAWLTPAELFSPWYGAVLARHMMEHRKHNLGQEGAPVDVVEIGGGNGTLARDILNWLRDNAPSEYARATYTCLEISPRLAAQQYDLVVTRGGHAGRFRVLRADASLRSGWGAAPDFRHCFILMMEVLDNLPHDKVYRPHEEAPWMQTAVRVDRDATACGGGVPGRAACMEEGPWVEVLEPLTDPLLQRALPLVYRRPTFDEKMDVHLNKVLDFLLAKRADPEYKGEGETVFVPTACLSLMDVLHEARPNHSLIAADFDSLPDIRLLGRNAPLVAEKTQGVNQDHDTLLVPWGSCDIFFPTDFDALARLYLNAAAHVWKDMPGAEQGRVAYAHYKQGEVLRRYREMEKTATLLSFNPMVNDFQNARFFLGDSYGRKAPAMAPAPAATVTAAGAPPAYQPPAAPHRGRTPGYDQPVPGLEPAMAASAAGAAAAGAQRQAGGAGAGQGAAGEPPRIDFSWQWGHGKGMQHAPAKPARNPFFRSTAKQPAGPNQQQQQQQQQGAGAGGAAGKPAQKPWFTVPVPLKQAAAAAGAQKQGPVVSGRLLRPRDFRPGAPAGAAWRQPTGTHTPAGAGPGPYNQQVAGAGGHPAVQGQGRGQQPGEGGGEQPELQPEPVLGGRHLRVNPGDGSNT